MSDKQIKVYINLEGKDLIVGTLRADFIRGKESSSFEYSSEWLDKKIVFR